MSEAVLVNIDYYMIFLLIYVKVRNVTYVTSCDVKVIMNLSLEAVIVNNSFTLKGKFCACLRFTIRLTLNKIFVSHGCFYLKLGEHCNIVIYLNIYTEYLYGASGTDSVFFACLELC